MSKYSKEYIKEKLREFSPKELRAFKRLVQEFNYPVERAFEKIIGLKNRESKPQSAITPEDTSPIEQKEEQKEEIVKNEGGQNIIKPVEEDEFELIDVKEEIEPVDNSPRTKDFSTAEIISVLTPEEIEVESLSSKQKETYDRLIKNGFSHEDALREAYIEAKKELIEKLEHLEAFYGIDEQNDNNL
jgi:hypothetical protein